MSLSRCFELLDEVKDSGPKWDKARTNLRVFLGTYMDILPEIGTERGRLRFCLLLKDTGPLEEQCIVYFRKHKEHLNEFQGLLTQMIGVFKHGDTPKTN